MTVYGRKPAAQDVGYGEMLPGRMRGSIMDRLTANAWLIAFGGRLGRNTGSAATVEYAAYTANGSTMLDRVGVSGTFSVDTAMADSWSGADFVKRPAAPIRLSLADFDADAPNLGLAVRASGASIAHGQDNSGHLMHERSVSSFPTPFGSTNTRPEGKMSLWAEVQPNRRPETPGNLQPRADGMTSDTTPEIGCDFRDPDEVLPGYSLGQADKMSAWQLQVWSENGQTKLHDSGKTPATTFQQNARRVTWVTPTLAPGTYVLSGVVWDQFDTGSEPAIWRITVNAGGSMADVKLADSVILQRNADDPSNPDLIDALSPNVMATWTHQSGQNATQLTFAIRTVASVIAEVLGAPPSYLRGPTTVSGTFTPGTTVTRTFAQLGWSSLPRDQGPLMVTARGLDALGATSPWGASRPFVLNQRPFAGTPLSPSNVAVSQYPELRVRVTDGNDAAADVVTAFFVRVLGDAGNGVAVPGAQYDAGADQWVAVPGASQMPSYQQYQWRATPTDPWDGIGTSSPWTTFTFAPPPAVAITSPADGGTAANGTPNLTWTVDKPQASYRRELFDVVTGQRVADTGTVASTSARSVATPAGVLRNTRQYRARITVTSSDGLVGYAESTFTVSYPASAAITGLTVERVPGPFEPDADTSQWSRVALAWNEVSTSVVPNGEFGGYLVRRVDIATGLAETLAHILTRAERVFVDRTPTSGVTYRYEVVYLALRNLNDMIESTPASAQMGVTLVQSVICTLDDDDLGAPLRYWEDRVAKPVRSWEIVESFGPEPVAFQGLTDYRVLHGTFRVMDDQYGTFTARDLLGAVEAMGAPRLTDDGSPVPRIVCYRDPRRTILGVITDVDPADTRNPRRGEIGLEITETDARQGLAEPP